MNLIDYYLNHVYDELVKKAKVIDTIGLVKKQIMLIRSMGLKVKYLVLLT